MALPANCVCDTEWSDYACDAGCDVGGTKTYENSTGPAAWTATTCAAQGVCHASTGTDHAGCPATDATACGADTDDAVGGACGWVVGVLIAGTDVVNTGCPGGASGASPCDKHYNTETMSWCHIKRDAACEMWTTDYHSENGGGYFEGCMDPKAGAGGADGSTVSPAAILSTAAALVSLLFL